MDKKATHVGKVDSRLFLNIVSLTANLKTPRNVLSSCRFVNCRRKAWSFLVIEKLFWHSKTDIAFYRIRINLIVYTAKCLQLFEIGDVLLTLRYFLSWQFKQTSKKWYVQIFVCLSYDNDIINWVNELKPLRLLNRDKKQCFTSRQIRCHYTLTITSNFFFACLMGLTSNCWTKSLLLVGRLNRGIYFGHSSMYLFKPGKKELKNKCHMKDPIETRKNDT